MPAIAVMGFVALLAAAVLALRRRHLAN